jgi:DNA-binding MarR family transcriptional regulator
MRSLWAVAHGVESASKQMLAEIGVTGTQRLVLRLIGHYGSLSPGRLSELLHLDPSSLTGVLRRLESSAFIKRKRDPSDGRRAILSLTAKGRALNARRARTIEASVRQTLAAVPAAHVRATREVLRALAHELSSGAKVLERRNAGPEGARAPGASSSGR